MEGLSSSLTNDQVDLFLGFCTILAWILGCLLVVASLAEFVSP